MAQRTQVIARHLQPLPNKYPEPEALQDKKLPAKNPHLVGNFAPTTSEGEFTELQIVEGKVPDDLRGSYMRVGPNPRFDFDGLPYHAFDGDGLIHSFTFPASGHKPFYVKRWVRTRRLITSEYRGFDVAEMGEQMMGSFSYGEHIIDNKAPGAMKSKAGERMGRANTNLVTYSNRVFALEEADMPYEVTASWDPVSHLRTVGRFDFNKKLRHAVTAHPKVDPETGEMFFFCYGILEPKVTYSVGSPEGKLLSTIDIELPNSDSGSMMHDMVLTKNYSLLFDMRLIFSMEAIGEGKNPWVHQKDQPARFGVLPRYATKPDDVVWIDVTPCAVFHFANAWEEPDGKIVVVGSRLRTISFNAGERTDGDEVAMANMHIWTLDVKQRKCISERTISSHPCDFVQIDASRTGRKTRYVYAAKLIGGSEAPKQYKDSLFVNPSLLKYDLKTGTVREIEYRSETGSPMFGTEAVFAPRLRRNPNNEEDEDNGYLVVITHNEETQTSDCIVYDARTLKLECRIRSPERVPYGFHAHWVVGDALK